MKLKYFFLTILLFVSPSGFCEVGNDLLSNCQEFLTSSKDASHTLDDNMYMSGKCIGYINATLDTSEYYVIRKAVDDKSNLSFADKLIKYEEYCLSNEIKNIQSVKLVVKYLNDHPEELGYSPTVIILHTMKNYFPCSKLENSK